MRTDASASPRPARVGVVVLLAMAAALVGIVAGPGEAEATSYRFWTYWTGGDSGWSFATVGASRVPADGAVEGWRFAVSAASTSTAPPRTAKGFSAVCGSTPPVAGSKRVALVVDYGSASDAPPGVTPPAGVVTHCAVVPTSANGYAVLDDYASLRVESGLVCGIGGYPARGCGEPVSDPPTDDGGAGAGPGSGSGTGSPGATGGASQGGSAGSGERTNDPHPQPKTSPGRTDDPTGKPDRANPGSAGTAGSSPPDPSGPEATPVAAATVTTPPAPTAGSPTGVVVAVVALSALGGAALLVSRRRRARA